MKNRNHIRTALAGIALILSIAMVIRWVTGEHLAPWTTSVTVNRPLQEVRSSHGLFILDNAYHRIIRADEKGKVDALVTFDNVRGAVNRIQRLCATDEALYAVGIKNRKGGIFAQNEQILRFRTLGDLPQSIFIHQYSDSDFVAKGQILNLWEEEGDLRYLTCEGDKCVLYSLGTNAATTDELLTPDTVAVYPVHEPILKAIRNTDGSFTLLGKYSRTDYSETLPQDGQLPLSTGLIVHNLLFIIAVAYILLLIIMGLFRLFRNRQPQQSTPDSTHHVRNAVMLAVTALLIAGFYTHHLYKGYQDAYNRQVCALRQQLDFLVLNDYRDVLEGIAAEGQTYIDDSAHLSRLQALNRMMAEMTHTPSLNQDLYSDIFRLSEDGRGLHVADANNQYLFGEEMSTAEEMQHIMSNPASHIPYKIWDIAGSYWTSISQVEIDGTHFFIEAGFKENDVKHSSMMEVLEIFFTLLIAFLILYTIYNLLQRLPLHWKSFRAARQQQQADAGVWLSGVVSFLFYAISAIDQGVMVYLVYQMSEGCTPADMALRASLPMMLYMGFGMVAYIIQPALRKWWGDRNVNMGAGVLAVAVFCFIALGVYEKNFAIYCVGKALSGPVLGIVFNSMYALPLIAKEHSLRNEGLASITLSCLAANILFISLGGYIGQYLGYTAVYVVNALLSVVVIAVAAIVFPKQKNENVSEETTSVVTKQEGTLKKTLQFLLSGRMIAYYLGILLPFGAMNAYCYYLYPIYAENAGISVSGLANMIVFGYALAFIFGERLVRWKNRQNGLWVLVNVVMIMAILEMAFSVAGNIYWATLVLMACCVMVTIPRSEANVFIADEGKKKGLDVRDTNSGFAFAMDATEALAGPLMGWCVGFGLVIGTNLLGFIGFCLTGVFAVWQRIASKQEKTVQTRQE